MGSISGYLANVYWGVFDWQEIAETAEFLAKTHVPFALISNLNTDTLAQILKNQYCYVVLTKAEAPLIGFPGNVLTASKPTGGPLFMECNVFSKIIFHIDFTYLSLFHSPLANDPFFNF